MTKTAQKQIVVVTQGFVLIGDVTPGTDHYVLRDASVIRQWGTTKGLGQIALEGPTPSTKLDPCGTVRVEKHAVVMRIDCVSP